MEIFGPTDIELQEEKAKKTLTSEDLFSEPTDLSLVNKKATENDQLMRQGAKPLDISVDEYKPDRPEPKRVQERKSTLVTSEDLFGGGDRATNDPMSKHYKPKGIDEFPVETGSLGDIGELAEGAVDKVFKHAEPMTEVTAPIEKEIATRASLTSEELFEGVEKTKPLKRDTLDPDFSDLPVFEGLKVTEPGITERPDFSDIPVADLPTITGKGMTAEPDFSGLPVIEGFNMPKTEPGRLEEPDFSDLPVIDLSGAKAKILRDSPLPERDRVDWDASELAVSGGGQFILKGLEHWDSFIEKVMKTEPITEADVGSPTLDMGESKGNLWNALQDVGEQIDDHMWATDDVEAFSWWLPRIAKFGLDVALGEVLVVGAIAGPIGAAGQLRLLPAATKKQTLTMATSLSKLRAKYGDQVIDAARFIFKDETGAIRVGKQRDLVRATIKKLPAKGRERLMEVRRYFGVTEHPTDAGFINADGSLLDLSNASLARDKQMVPGQGRKLAHFSVSEAWGGRGSVNELFEFMDQTQGIRLSYAKNELNLEIMHRPTSLQMDAIFGMVRKGVPVYVDIVDQSGSFIASRIFKDVIELDKFLRKFPYAQKHKAGTFNISGMWTFNEPIQMTKVEGKKATALFNDYVRKIQQSKTGMPNIPNNVMPLMRKAVSLDPVAYKQAIDDVFEQTLREIHNTMKGRQSRTVLRNRYQKLLEMVDHEDITVSYLKGFEEAGGDNVLEKIPTTLHDMTEALRDTNPDLYHELRGILEIGDDAGATTFHTFARKNRWTVRETDEVRSELIRMFNEKYPNYVGDKKRLGAYLRNMVTDQPERLKEMADDSAYFYQQRVARGEVVETTSEVATIGGRKRRLIRQKTLEPDLRKPEKGYKPRDYQDIHTVTHTYRDEYGNIIRGADGEPIRDRIGSLRGEDLHGLKSQRPDDDMGFQFIDPAAVGASGPAKSFEFTGKQTIASAEAYEKVAIKLLPNVPASHNIKSVRKFMGWTDQQVADVHSLLKSAFAKDVKAKDIDLFSYKYLRENLAELDRAVRNIDGQAPWAYWPEVTTAKIVEPTGRRGRPSLLSKLEGLDVPKTLTAGQRKIFLRDPGALSETIERTTVQTLNELGGSLTRNVSDTYVLKRIEKLLTLADNKDLAEVLVEAGGGQFTDLLQNIPRAINEFTVTASDLLDNISPGLKYEIRGRLLERALKQAEELKVVAKAHKTEPGLIRNVLRGGKGVVVRDKTAWNAIERGFNRLYGLGRKQLIESEEGFLDFADLIEAFRRLRKKKVVEKTGVFEHKKVADMSLKEFRSIVKRRGEFLEWDAPGFGKNRLRGRLGEVYETAKREGLEYSRELDVHEVPDELWDDVEPLYGNLAPEDQAELFRGRKAPEDTIPADEVRDADWWNTYVDNGVTNGLAEQNESVAAKYIADELKRRGVVPSKATARARELAERRVAIREMEKMADNLSLTKDELLDAWEDVSLTPAKVIAMNRAVTKTAVNLEKTAKVALRTGSPDDLERFVVALENATAARDAVRAFKASIARSLRVSGIGKMDDTAAVSRLLNEIGTPEGIAKSKKTLERFMKVVAGGEPSINAFIMANRLHPVIKMTDSAFEYWVNSILSSPTTHIVNTVSNFVTSGIAAPVEKAVAGVLAGQKGVYTAEAVDYLKGWLSSLFDGNTWRLTWDALWDDVPYHLTKVEYDAYRAKGVAIPGVPGKAIRTPGRVLNAMDEFFSSLGKAGEVRALAYREGRITEELVTRLNQLKARGMNFDDALAKLKSEWKYTKEFPYERSQIIRRYNMMTKQKLNRDEVVRELLNDQKWMIDAAERADTKAEYRIFRQPAGHVGGPAFDLIGKTPLRWIIPFRRTPTNIVKMSLEYSPFNFIRVPIRKHHDLVAELFNKPHHLLTREEVMEGYARATMGSLIWAMAGILAHQGLVTGGGPITGHWSGDYTARRRKERAGWNAYSFKNPFTGNYTSYKRIEPFSMIMGPMATLFENYKHLSVKERGERFDYISKMLNDHVVDQSFMKGFKDMVEAVGSEYKLEQMASRIGSGFMPFSSFMGSLGRAMDPTITKKKGVVQRAQDRMPVARESLPPSRDVWGKERKMVPEGRSGLWTYWPYRTGPVEHGKAHPVDLELDRLGISKGQVKNRLKIKGEQIELTPEQHDQYQVLAGKYAFQKINQLVNSKWWKRTPDEKKQKYIAKAFNSARARARTELKRSMK